MDNLNKQQRAAVTAADGPVLISAGPGTGKTKTLTARIIHLIETKRTKPHDILALTFTKKAAQEMQERVGQKGPAICTFHALCSTLLGGKHTFVTDAQRVAIIKALPKPSVLAGMNVRELGLHISLAKNHAEAHTGIAPMVDAYNAALRERGWIDFDDLLLLTRDGLKAGAIQQSRYRYILIDEFQDTNMLQYELLHLLRRNDNVFVIGDPNQSIYGFRGASGDIFNQFKVDFPDAAAIALAYNYRSAAPIVAVSNAIFKDAPQLHAASHVQGYARAFELLNEYSEAHWIMGEIQDRIGGSDLQRATHHDGKASLRDFAIIYRSRRASKTIQKYIVESGLPYQVVGDGSPYEQPEVQTLIALLRNIAGEQVPVPQFTPGQVEVLLAAIDASAAPAYLAHNLKQIFAIQETAELKQIIGTLVRFARLADAIVYFDELEANGFYDPSAEAITLLTIHAAKGLEFPHVFLLAAEEGILPSKKGDIPEERRLFYVAVTRAKEQLDITYVTRRANERAVMSQFIAELPTGLLPRVQDPNLAADKRRLQKRQAKRAQTSLF